MSAADVLFRLDAISKTFGATRALHRVDLAVRRSEVHALIGENGAGKSTLMKILSGAVRPANDWAETEILRVAKSGD